MLLLEDLARDTAGPKDAVSIRGLRGCPRPSCVPESTCLPPPTALRSISKPCPVTMSWVWAWAFPKTFRASQTYKAWSSGATPEGRKEA